MSDSSGEISFGIVPVHMHSSKIMDAAKHVETINIDQSTKLEVFTFIVNSNRFDYNRVADVLLESVYEFALSRKTIKEHINNSDFMRLSHDAVENLLTIRNLVMVSWENFYCFVF